MTRMELLLIGLLAVVAVVGTAHAVAGKAARHGWHGTEAPTSAGLNGGHWEAWHSRRHGFARPCDGRWIDHGDVALDHVEAALDLKPEQAEAWAALAGRVRASGAILADVCEKLKRTEGSEAGADALGRAEVIMAAGLAAIREIRPAYEGFHGVLTEQQRKKLDRLITRRRRR